MQIQILVFLENLIPVQRVLLGQRSAFFFHSPFPCTFIPSNQSASQSVTRNNTSSGTVLLHINRIHKSREPITNIPSIHRWGGQGGLEESRSSTRKLCTADSAGKEHNAYAPMSAFSLSLSLYGTYPPTTLPFIPFRGRCDVTECNGSWCRWLCETSDIIFWLLHQLPSPNEWTTHDCCTRFETRALE